jgi:hypothetical protein
MGTSQAHPSSTKKIVVKPTSTGKLIKIQGTRVSRLPQAIRRTAGSKAHPPIPPHTPCMPAAPLRPPPSIPRSTGEVNLRRLSIPPSTILRPLLEHGPLPTSPTKQPSDARARRRTNSRQKENVGEMFRSLFQGTLMRKSTESSVVVAGRARGMGSDNQRLGI